MVMDDRACTKRINNEALSRDKSDEGSFEWLTSPLSLRSCIADCLQIIDEAEKSQTNERKAIHIGCGTSTLGEMLLLDESFDILSVVNTDSDCRALQNAKMRWEQTCAVRQPPQKESAMEFRCVDYSLTENVTNVPEEFHLAVDKSTLDCLLCTDVAASNLLCNIYNSLLPNGVYLLISFHLIDFLMPLISDLPGSDWEVSFRVVERQVEAIVVGGKEQSKPGESDSPHGADDPPGPGSPVSRTTWSSTGSFAPNSAYRRTVNVLQCRKRSSGQLDPTHVYNHVHNVNNEWYASIHPLATEQRQATLAQSFRDGKVLDLDACYKVLFTDAEKDHYDMQDFLSDWDCFIETHSDLPKTSLTYDTAVLFLKEMQ